jgi:hypothetical protein
LQRVGTVHRLAHIFLRQIGATGPVEEERRQQVRFVASPVVRIR